MRAKRKSRPGSEKTGTAGHDSGAAAASNSHPTAVPVVVVEAHAPARGCSMFRAAVSCPYCRAMHIAVARDWHSLPGSIRRGACGRRYRLRVVSLILAEVPG